MQTPNLIWSLPFICILLAIAIFPLLAPNWWSRNYPWVVLPFGAIVVTYYLFFFNGGERLLHTAHEYVSFIALVGSLFIVTGGIHIGMFGEFTPKQNLALLAIGALSANLVGTTGASMILIRPYLRGNQWRIAPFHIVFFIFIVSNCGGALTPIGDPPLFLGYLKGIPFFWVFTHLWYKWLIAVFLLLVIFYFWDNRHYREQPKSNQTIAEEPDKILIVGRKNFIFLGIVVGAAFVQEPIFARELIMILAGITSYKLTPKAIHTHNQFSFHPVKEVAIIFAAIFASMIPALDWLAANAATLGLKSTGQFYWTTGVMSAFLDNAPTYLNFLTAAMGIHGFSADNKAHIIEWLGLHGDMLRSISIAAVFFGASTYIGNGPNFMVKAICDEAGVKTPSFTEYIYKYTLPILLPVLVVTYFMVR